MKTMPLGKCLGIMEALSEEWGVTWEEAGEAMAVFFPEVRSADPA